MMTFERLPSRDCQWERPRRKRSRKRLRVTISDASVFGSIMNLLYVSEVAIPSSYARMDTAERGCLPSVWCM